MLSKSDIGLLIEMLGPGTRADILRGNLGGFKGAIFENLMADTLHKKQKSLYYFLTLTMIHPIHSRACATPSIRSAV